MPKLPLRFKQIPHANTLKECGSSFKQKSYFLYAATAAFSTENKEKDPTSFDVDLLVDDRALKGGIPHICSIYSQVGNYTTNYSIHTFLVSKCSLFDGSYTE